ncbi:hypothetical protein AXH82_01865 [Microbacterium sp. PAMC 28756]|uniref:hypothetical protein n=1 Tax=Microbacterium sp. PAMC 28756 TaxID=1795053 RepID=UPI00076B1CFE|nr:hypothetical protein [Microbacterium sp. PAMC 28756]AMG82260.1 hypothetical protein AXH82_01865 [Microbacterium sp. PAMC 28756]
MSVGVVWAALAERATLSDVDLAELPRSEFLDAAVDVLIERVDPRVVSRKSLAAMCSHLGATEEGDLPDMIAFPGHAFVGCPACAVDFRDEIEAGQRRTCERCDTARASALHKALTPAEAGKPHVVFALALCEPCAVAEGLRGTDLVARSR